MGSGGAAEGVLGAAALRCVGGQFKGRLLFRNDDERGRAHKWGIEDLDKVYDLNDLAKGDCIFAATGVTDGSLLEGVKRLRGGKMTTESVVMRASSGTVRWVKGEHRIYGEGTALCWSVQLDTLDTIRAEERRGGQECGSTCRSRRWPCH